MHKKTGVLLINLGTPKSPAIQDVYRYLIEFLTDKRVIDYPWLQRQLLVRGVIVPRRVRQSAKSYGEIWTEEGSPLLVYGNRVKERVQNALGEGWQVELAMRYQEPSIKNGLKKLLEQDVDHLIILPLFPQYASATTGSVFEKVHHELSKYVTIPKVTMINQFSAYPPLIESFVATAEGYDLAEYDKVLFSFHGLPERQLKEASRHQSCQCTVHCCSQKSSKNKDCYAAQCYQTAQGIIEKLKLPEARFQITFQSRLGKEPWLQPYTSEVIINLAKQGCKKVLVFCPSFVCDCLETIYEIGLEYAAEFKHHGGERLDFVPGLNDHPKWIEALSSLIREHK